MAKGSKALSGAAKDAYLKRALRSEPDIPDAARERLTGRLQGEIAMVSLRAKASAADALDSLPVPADALPADAAAPLPPAPAPVENAGTAGHAAFDPYQPNVIVVIRTRGREAVLAELDAIADVDHLRLIAREQQLGIAADLAQAHDIRQAIVSAAERRIANRRAAAS